MKRKVIAALASTLLLSTSVYAGGYGDKKEEGKGHDKSIVFYGAYTGSISHNRDAKISSTVVAPTSITKGPTVDRSFTTVGSTGSTLLNFFGAKATFNDKISLNVDFGLFPEENTTRTRQHYLTFKADHGKFLFGVHTTEFFKIVSAAERFHFRHNNEVKPAGSAYDWRAFGATYQAKFGTTISFFRQTAPGSVDEGEVENPDLQIAHNFKFGGGSLKYGVSLVGYFAERSYVEDADAEEVEYIAQSASVYGTKFYVKTKTATAVLTQSRGINLFEGASSPIFTAGPAKDMKAEYVATALFLENYFTEKLAGKVYLGHARGNSREDGARDEVSDTYGIGVDYKYAPATLFAEFMNTVNQYNEETTRDITSISFGAKLKWRSHVL